MAVMRLSKKQTILWVILYVGFAYVMSMGVYALHTKQDYVEALAGKDGIVVENTSSSTEGEFFITGKDGTQLIKVTNTGVPYRGVKTYKKYEHEVLVKTDTPIDKMLQESMKVTSNN